MDSRNNCLLQPGLNFSLLDELTAYISLQLLWFVFSLHNNTPSVPDMKPTA